MIIQIAYLWLVLLQVPKCFGLVQIFLCLAKKSIYIIVAVTNNLCQTERQFAFSKIGFCAGSAKPKILGWLKTFGPAQNILGPV